MKTIIYKRIAYPLMLLAGFILAGCNPHSMTKCGPCPALAQVIPNMTFRVVDKTTSQDLFFGAQAKYKPAQLKMFHIINGKPDTAVLRTDTVNHYFNISLIPSHPVDTVTMQIAALPQDELLFKMGITPGCCPFVILSSVSFNGEIVYKSANAGSVVVLSK